MSFLDDNVPDEFTKKEELIKMFDGKRFNSARRLFVWDATHWFIACIVSTDFELIKMINEIFYGWWRQDNRGKMLDKPFWKRNIYRVDPDQILFWQKLSNWWSSKIVVNLEYDIFPFSLKPSLAYLPFPSESRLKSDSLIPFPKVADVTNIKQVLTEFLEAEQAPRLQRAVSIRLLDFFSDQDPLQNVLENITKEFDFSGILNKYADQIALTDTKPKTPKINMTTFTKRTISLSTLLAKNIAAALVYCDLKNNSELLRNDQSNSAASSQTSSVTTSNGTTTTLPGLIISFVQSNDQRSFTDQTLLSDSDDPKFILINTKNSPIPMYYHLLLHLGEVYFTNW